jgi:hypothetical protein
MMPKYHASYYILDSREEDIEADSEDDVREMLEARYSEDDELDIIEIELLPE